jgi:hypothetical protein
MALSTTRTRAPARRAQIAAHIAALPPPMTSTSYKRFDSCMNQRSLSPRNRADEHDPAEERSPVTTSFVF